MTTRGFTTAPPSARMDLYKLNCGGIVYLVEPKTGRAFTYDLKNPTPIGQIIWKDIKALPQIKLDENWREVLNAKKAATETAV